MLRKAQVGTWDVLVRWYVKAPMMVKTFVSMLAVGLVMGTALGFGQLVITWLGN